MQKLCIKCSDKNNSPRSKFCSIKCRLFGYEKKCKHCNNKFLGHLYAKYCSKTCSGHDHKEELIKRSSKKPAEYYFCKRCSSEKKYSNFRQVNKELSQNTKKRDGWWDIEGKQRYSYCKPCEIKWSSERYRLNPYRQIHYSAKKRALEKNVPFELTREDLKQLYENIPKKCPILGIKLEHTKIGTTKYQTDNSPSLDRMIPHKGYVKDNVMIISALANRIKQDANSDQIKKVYEFLKIFENKTPKS